MHSRRTALAAACKGVDDRVGSLQYDAKRESAANAYVQLVICWAVDTILEGLPIRVEWANTSEVRIDPGTIEHEIVQTRALQFDRADAIAGAVVLEKDDGASAGIHRMIAAILFNPEEDFEHHFVAVYINIGRAPHRHVIARARAHIRVALNPWPTSDQVDVAYFVYLQRGGKRCCVDS